MGKFIMGTSTFEFMRRTYIYVGIVGPNRQAFGEGIAKDDTCADIEYSGSFKYNKFHGKGK